MVHIKKSTVNVDFFLSPFPPEALSAPSEARCPMYQVSRRPFQLLSQRPSEPFSLSPLQRNGENPLKSGFP